jgi:hypothetical protein
MLPVTLRHIVAFDYLWAGPCVAAAMAHARREYDASSDV